MPPFISKTQAIREEPTQGLIITARFSMADDVDMSPKEIRGALQGVEIQLRNVFSDSAARGYSRSGLRVRSGQLKRQAMTNFKVRVIVRGKDIVVEAEWFPTIKYFKIHVWGGEIVPRRAKVLRFKIGKRVIFAMRVFIPKRNFLFYDERARALTRDILNNRLADAAAGIVRRAPRPQPPVPTTAIPPRPAERIRRVRAQTITEREARLTTRLIKKVQAERARDALTVFRNAGGRITPHSVRRALRIPRGGLSPSAARMLVDQFQSVGLERALLAAIIGGGQFIKRDKGFQVFVPIGKVPNMN